MFAFAIYDGRKRELFAARDRLGKKPFFYTVLDGVFHFASELPALARSPLWKGELDLSALEGYLSLGYFIAPATIFRDVYKLLPGHWLRVANGRIETRQYWDVTEFDTEHRPDDELLREIDETLRHGRAFAPRERGPARRVPQRRHRLRPGRVLHGGSAAATGWSRRRSGSAKRRTTSSRRPA